MSDIVKNTKEAMEHYRASLAKDQDFLDDIEQKIYDAIYFGSTQRVSISMFTDEWDAVLYLLRQGRKSLPKQT